MKRIRLALLFALLTAPLLLAEGTHYRLEYEIRGGAISRILFFFPLRVYYEASASVDLMAVQREDGVTGFAYAGLPRVAHVLRTLGFTAKSLALLIVNRDEGGGKNAADGLLADWKARTPEFSERIKKVKIFPHQLQVKGPQPFAFERNAFGYYQNFQVGLEPRYLYYPARTGLYFKVFLTLADLLKLLNHPCLPAVAGTAVLPATWEGDDLDFSADLNRVAGLIEEVVKSLVTVKQKFPFRMHFHVAARNTEWIEICGEAHPDVPLWKGFMIREVRRRVRLRPNGRELLADEFSMEIRNKKGQGGFGRVLLKRMDFKEDDR